MAGYHAQHSGHDRRRHGYNSDEEHRGQDDHGHRRANHALDGYRDDHDHDDQDVFRHRLPTFIRGES